MLYRRLILHAYIYDANEYMIVGLDAVLLMIVDVKQKEYKGSREEKKVSEAAQETSNMNVWLCNHNHNGADVFMD